MNGRAASVMYCRDKQQSVMNYYYYYQTGVVVHTCLTAYFPEQPG